MSWGCGCLNQKACELVIVCLVGKVIKSVAKLYSWWFIISDLQCQEWQHSRQCAQTPSCRVLSRAPVVLIGETGVKEPYSQLSFLQGNCLSFCALLFIFIFLYILDVFLFSIFHVKSSSLWWGSGLRKSNTYLACALYYWVLCLQW